MTPVVSDGHHHAGQSWSRKFLKKELGAGKDISWWPHLFSKGSSCQAPKVDFRAESKAEEEGEGGRSAQVL